VSGAGVIENIFVIDVSEAGVEQFPDLFSNRLVKIPIKNGSRIGFPTLLVEMTKFEISESGTHYDLYGPTFEKELDASGVNLYSTLRKQRILALAIHLRSISSFFPERLLRKNPPSTTSGERQMFPIGDLVPIKPSSEQLLVMQYHHHIRHDVDDYDQEG